MSLEEAQVKMRKAWLRALFGVLISSHGFTFPSFAKFLSLRARGRATVSCQDGCSSQDGSSCGIVVELRWLSIQEKGNQQPPPSLPKRSVEYASVAWSICGRALALR